MKYAILFLVILLIIFISLILFLKKKENKNIKTNKKEQIKPLSSNNNPVFEVTLINYRQEQLNIYRSNINDYLSFKKANDKRIKVLNNSKCIGLISTKDYKKFNLISEHPNYFEGKIISFIPQENTLKKVLISVQVKVEYSNKVYKKNKEYFPSLISIHSLFEKNQIIETSYGPSTILEIHDDHLIVDVPSLGKRVI